jgi:hypothetical protein
MPKKPASVKGPKGTTGGCVTTDRYASRFGTKLKNGGYAYKGLNHRHWSRRFVCHRWHCVCWYCPCVGGWYYWCASHDCYLPVRYIVVYPPSEGDSAEPPDSEVVPDANEGPDLPE